MKYNHKMQQYYKYIHKYIHTLLIYLLCDKVALIILNDILMIFCIVLEKA